MIRSKLRQCALVVGLIAFGIAGTLLAQALLDSPQRQEKQRVELLGPNGSNTGMEVIASVAEYKPGEGIDLHLHHGIEALYVVQGAQIQSPGRTGNSSHWRQPDEFSHGATWRLQSCGRCIIKTLYCSCRRKGEAAVRQDHKRRGQHS
jgi:hypothetical protein